MVLEAREKAEKVGYPIVGEEVKDASNVVDYDIREEITIDTSSVFNANNDTTTGMANVIPGVNAPKLIAETSIIGGLGGGGGVSYSDAVLATLVRTETSWTKFDKVNSSNLSPDLELDGYKIVCPEGGIYLIQATINTNNGYASFTANLYIYEPDTSIVSRKGNGGIDVSTLAIAQIPAGMRVVCELQPAYSCRPELTIKFLKLG